MSAAVVIRPLRLNERADWEPLWKGYLDFYKTSVPKEVYDTTWARLHDPHEPMWLLGATVDGSLRGIVHYIYHRCLLYTSPSPRDGLLSRMPSSA